MQAHSKIGASSMERWGTCPASVRLSEGLPNISSSFAQEGTEAHALFALLLLSLLLTDPEQEGRFPDEMFQHLVPLVELITKLCEEAGAKTLLQAVDKGILFVEHRFDLSKIHPGCFGTADVVIWNPLTRVLYVYDLKYGAGIPVEVEHNEQLLYYALGALITLNLPVKEVEIGVMQPRCSHKDGFTRTWRILGIDLLDFKQTLIEKAKATEDPNAPLVSGSHCRFCPAAAVCPARHEEANAVAIHEFSQLEAYDPTALSETLDKIDRIEDWCKSVREFAYAESQRGRTPPRYKLVKKRATRKWSEDIAWASLPKTIKKNLKEKDFWVPITNLISPAQAEKVLKSKGLEIDLLQDFITAESSGTKLVPESAPGEPVLVGPVTDFDALE